VIRVIKTNNAYRKSQCDLRQLTLGVHQLKLEKSYTIEHQNADNSYEMFFNKHDPMKTYFWERFKVVMHQVEHIINWGSGKSFASVRYALQSTEQLKSISL
jgi:hypothetical protein